ncbi:hypothetical protein ABPG72_001775 [Tetrahymena utriculariae]
MSCFIYSKFSFEKNYQRIQIDENLFFEDKISIEDLEDYLKHNVYMTPVQILQQSVSDEQFVYNYSSLILQLKERTVQKILNFIFENNSYELILRLPKNRSTFKIKFLLNLIKKQLKIDSRIYISTLNQTQFQLDDSVSVLETIYISVQPFKSSPKKLITQNESIHFDQLSDASTSDQSLIETKERSSDILIDLLFDPSEFNSTKMNNLQYLKNNNYQDKMCIESNVFINKSETNTQYSSSSDFFQKIFNPSQFNSTQTNIQQCINNINNQMQICVEKNNISNGIPIVSNKIHVFPIPPKPLNQQNRTTNPLLKKSSLLNSSINKKFILNNRLNYDNEDVKAVCIPIKKSIKKQY